MARFPISANSDGISNRSTVSGDSVTDALDTLAGLTSPTDLQAAYTAGNSIEVAGSLPVEIRNATGDPLAPLLGVLDNAGTTEIMKVSRDGIVSDAARPNLGDLSGGLGVGNGLAVISAGVDGEVLTVDSTAPGGWSSQAAGGGGVTLLDLIRTATAVWGYATTGISSSSMIGTCSAANATYTDASSSVILSTYGHPVFSQLTSTVAGNEARIETTLNASILYSNAPVYVRKFYMPANTTGVKTAMGIANGASNIMDFPIAAFSDVYALKQSDTDFGSFEFRFQSSANDGADVRLTPTGVTPSTGIAYTYLVYLPSATSAQHLLYGANMELLASQLDVGLPIKSYSFKGCSGVETAGGTAASHLTAAWGWGSIQGVVP